MYAIAPAQKEEVLWVAPEREPFMTPTILKASVVGTEGDLLKLDRVTKPVDRSQVYEINDSKYRDIEKARTEFGDALEELERLISRCECIAKYTNKSFVDSWAIAVKFQPNHVRVELAPWETPVIRVGKIITHSKEDVNLVDSENKKFRCRDLERVFILKGWSDWVAIERQIELCKESGDRFKSTLEQKLVQNVLDETRPALTVIDGGKIEEFVQPVDVEVVESRPLSQEEQGFYSLLDSKTRNWLLNEIEPEHSRLLREEFQFRKKATQIARQRGKLLLKAEEELSKIKIKTDNKYSKKTLFHLWLEVRYKEEMRCGTIESAKQLALNDKKLAIDPDFAKLPEEIIDKFDQSAAVKLASKGNEAAKARAIALAQDPEVKHISHSLASEMIAEQPGRQTENKPKLPKINKKLNPPPIAAAPEPEETSDIDNLRDVVKNGGTDDEIQMILDAIVAQKLDELKIEAKKKVWEETAREEAKEEVKETSRQFKLAIAELAKVKTERIQLQQKVEELEAKLAQVDEAEIVKENQDLKRIVNEYAEASLIKKQVDVKYHGIEHLSLLTFDKAKQLKTFQEMFTYAKELEIKLLTLESASAQNAVENSPQLEPDGDALIVETLPEELAIGN